MRAPRCTLQGARAARNADTEDEAFRAQANRAIKAWLRKKHPSDGAQLEGPRAGVQAVGMLMFSVTSRITAAGGLAEWSGKLVKVRTVPCMRMLLQSFLDPVLVTQVCPVLAGCKKTTHELLYRHYRLAHRLERDRRR